MNAYQSGALLRRIEERANAVTPDNDVTIVLNSLQIHEMAKTISRQNGNHTKMLEAKHCLQASQAFLMTQLERYNVPEDITTELKETDLKTPFEELPAKDKVIRQILSAPFTHAGVIFSDAAQNDDGFSLTIISPNAFISNVNGLLLEPFAGNGTDSNRIKPEILENNKYNITSINALHEEGHKLNPEEKKLRAKNKKFTEKNKEKAKLSASKEFKYNIPIMHNNHKLETFSDVYAILMAAKETNSTEAGRLFSNLRSLYIANPKKKLTSSSFGILSICKYNTSPALDKANDIADKMLKSGEMAAITDEGIVKLAHKITKKHRLKLHEFSSLAKSLDSGIGCTTLRKTVERANQADETINKVASPQKTSEVMAKYKTQSR